MVWLKRVRRESAGLRKFFLQFKPNATETETEEEMAKRKKLKGRSARYGKAPSPYQKYNKTPYRYSSDYYDWKTRVTGRNSRYAD